MSTQIIEHLSILFYSIHTFIAAVSHFFPLLLSLHSSTHRRFVLKPIRLRDFWSLATITHFVFCVIQFFIAHLYLAQLSSMPSPLLTLSVNNALSLIL